jgi:hypothetical protein
MHNCLQYISRPNILGVGNFMSRHITKTPNSSPRLLASAIGVAISASSVAHMAQAAEET